MFFDSLVGPLNIQYDENDRRHFSAGGNMMKKISVWILFPIALLFAACRNNPVPQPPIATAAMAITATLTSTPTIVPVSTETSQPSPLPVEFVWTIAGVPNPFNAPVGIALDIEGNLYVMDTKNSRVQKFDSDGNFLLMWGSPGNENGQFLITIPDEGRLAVDTQGYVYVLDDSNFRIQKFDSNGNFLTKWGTRGNAEGQFEEPSDIAIDKQNNVYVVDYITRVVQKFDENGKFLLRWGSTANVPLTGLYSVAIDPDGNVLVADEIGRILKFDGNGNFLSTFPLKKLYNRAIDTWNIAVDTQGNIYIADHGGYRIVKLNSQGEIIATWRGSETGAAVFNSLEDIAVDGRGNIYITDSASNIVQKFRQTTLRP
jgi:tripartite motif-containing protein 71